MSKTKQVYQVYFVFANYKGKSNTWTKIGESCAPDPDQALKQYLEETDRVVSETSVWKRVQTISEANYAVGATSDDPHYFSVQSPSMTQLRKFYKKISTDQ